MKQSTVFDCRMIQLPRITSSESGTITAVNNNVEVPFAIKRVYYLYDVPGGESRGGHAHYSLQQVIVAASGSFEILMDDGKDRRTFYLARPYDALYVPPGLWRELQNFSSGAICLVLASDVYAESDYIRTYDLFQQYKTAK